MAYDEADARREERDALEKQLLRADATRARAEYTAAVKWIEQITGFGPERINEIIAGNLARAERK